MGGLKVRVKVSSVRGIRDFEGEEAYLIEFVEVRERPPMVVMTPTSVPNEVKNIVMQISKGLQTALPGASKGYELRKLIVKLTAEELEAFGLKPYPNQVYEMNISRGKLSFKKVG